MDSSIAVRRGPGVWPDGDRRAGDRDRWPIVVGSIAAAAWAVIVISWWTSPSGFVHQHGLAGVDTSPWIGLSVFVAGWSVMTAAMMLPASVPAVRVFARSSVVLDRPTLGWAGFVGGYAVPWIAFGVLAGFVVLGLDRLAGASPWIAAHRWTIEAGALAAAAAYQFSPWKRRGLAACREPDGAGSARRSGSAGLRRGVAHGLDCLLNSGPLMLVMCVAGLASPLAMAGLAGAMAYESMGRHGRRAGSIVGAVLAWVALLVVLSGSSVG